jgi:predicted RNA-binding protein with EMAP domain
MYILADLKLDDGQSVAVLTVPPKEFKTGSRGFFGSTKAEINGKRYQIQIQVVEIGSKSKQESSE